MNRFTTYTVHTALGVLMIYAALQIKSGAASLRSYEEPARRHLAPVVIVRASTRHRIEARPTHVSRNPFAQAGRGPVPAFALSATVTPGVDQGATSLSARVLFKLLGTTVISGESGFAVISATSESPRTVRKGDRVMDWEVVSISRGKIKMKRGNRVEELELGKGI